MTTPTIETRTTCYGDVEHTRDGLLHSTAVPATTRTDGPDIWALRGKYVVIDYTDRDPLWYLDHRLMGRREATRQEVYAYAKETRDIEMLTLIGAYDAARSRREQEATT